MKLQTAYKPPDFVTEIKIGRLEWLKHVMRMERAGIPEMIWVLNRKEDVELEDSDWDG